MTYEVGQKVMTPLGGGEIKKVETWSDGHTQLVVSIKGVVTRFLPSQLKPYKTPHERLIEMGYEEKIHDMAVESETKNGYYKQYVKHPSVILIALDQKDFTTYTLYNGSEKNVDDVAWISLELSRILTDYLEWLEEEK